MDRELAGILVDLVFLGFFITAGWMFYIGNRLRKLEAFMNEFEEEELAEDFSAHITGMKESILEFGVPYDESLIPEDFEGTCVFTDRTVKVTQEEEE